MNQFASLFIFVAFVAFVQANNFYSGSSDGTSFRNSYSAPSLTFTSNSAFELQYFAQYLSPSSGYSFNAVVFVADVNTAAVLYTSEPFTLYNYGATWYNSSYLGWNLPATNSSKYSIGMMIDVQAYYYYSTTQTNTDGVLSSYLDNGNFAGSFAVSTFTCCGAVNPYSSITYTPTYNPPPSGNVFTSGSNYTYTSRSSLYATALAFQTTTPVTITQFGHFIFPQVNFGASFNAEVVIANLNTSSILYTSGAFSLTAYGPAFYSLPFNLSFAITPGTRYAIGMMTDVTTYYYYSLNQVSTDGTLFGYPSNANFLGSFYNPSIDCCYSANIYSQIQYVYSNSTPNGTGTFTSGNATANNYRASYNAAALTFMSNTGITLTSVSQYLYPQGGTPFSGMVVVANLNTSQIVYTSSVFPLQQNGSVAQFYSSPSINVTLQPFVMYSVGIMLNTPTYIYYSTGGGNTDGTITSYARNANFNGNFQSQTIDCCYSANIYTTLTYIPGNVPPPPNNNTGNFTSGGSTQNAYRYAFNPAALNVQSNTNWVLTSVSQYLNPTGSSFQGVVLVANLNTSQIVYTSPAFYLTGYGQGWYTSPSINVSLSAYTNYGIAIMLNTQTYIFYTTNDGGNTDGTLTSYDANANFVGNFTSPVVQCCASANIYTSLTYTTNYVPPTPGNSTNFTSGSAAQNAYRSSYNPGALSFASNTPITLNGVSQWLAPSVPAGTPFAGMVVVANLNTSSIFWTSPVFPLVSYSTQAAWYSSPSFNLSLDSGVNYAVGIMLNVSTYIYYTTSGGNTDGTITSYARNANFQGSFMSPTIDCCYSANIYTTLSYSTGGYVPPNNGLNFTAGSASLSTYRSAFNDAILNFKSNSDFVLTSVSQWLNPTAGNVSAVAIVTNLNTNQVLYISPVWTFQAYGYSGWVSSPSLSVSLQSGINYGVGVVLNTATYLFYDSTVNSDGVMTSFASNGNVAGSDFNSLSVSCCASATIYTSFSYTLGEEGNSFTFRNYKSELVENIQGASADALDE